MVWHIVKFLKEDLVEAVPSSWYKSENLTCYWPPRGTKTEQLLKYIKHLHLPLGTWSLHSATLLGTYDDFDIAQKKVEKAKTTSDISSANEAIKGLQPKRNRKKNRKYFEEDQSSELESDSDPEDYFPSLKRKNVGISSFGSSSLTPKQKNLPSTQSLISTPSFRRSKSFSPQGKITEPTERQDTPRTDSQIHEKTIIRTGHQTIDNTPNNNHDHAVIDTEFKELVLQELAKISLQINALQSSVATLVDVQNLQNASHALPNADKLNQLKLLQERLPITTMDKLDEFENWLKEEEGNYNFLVMEFRRIGGHSHAQLMRKILYRTISNDVAINFSWDGHKQKTAFKSFKLARAIIDSVKMHFNNAMETDIITVLKLWLVKAKERKLREAKLQENQSVDTMPAPMPEPHVN